MSSVKILRKNIRKFLPAFTLVELIIVIVILAILATIAFLSFNSYSAWARDSKRMSNVNLMAKWFELAIVQWRGINTSETAINPNITLSWSEIMHSWPFSWGLIQYQWYYDSPLGQKLLKSIWVWWWDINLWADSFQNYKFTYVPMVQKYQVVWLLEDQAKLTFYDNLNNLRFDESSIDLYNSVFADSGSWYIFLKWNYFATWWVEWLVPVQAVWDATPTNASWAKVIPWNEIVVNNAPVIPTAEPEVPTPPASTTCTFDATGSTGKFDSCTFWL